MIDDWLLSMLYAAWMAATTMPIGLMLGAPCSSCCGCAVADGKDRTDPKDEGTWVPSGTWRGAGGVTWTFNANPGDESGETWFFYGSPATSKVGGGASPAEYQDWGNICNWYSNKTTSPSDTSGMPSAFNKRATRLPPDTAVVHVYTNVDAASVGPRTVKNIYFWGSVTSSFIFGSEVTSTAAAHDSTGGAVFNGSSRTFGTVNGGATFNDFATNGSFGTPSGTVNDGATFNDDSRNWATVNDGGTFNDSSLNLGTGNSGATFNHSSQNDSTVNGGATFNDSSRNSSGFGTVNGGATFNDAAENEGFATVNDGATFNSTSVNDATVNGGGTFNASSLNSGTVNGGGTFNDSSLNSGTVNDGATFNDAACTTGFTGNFFASPCSRKFVAHPTDLPTCNGTAPTGCDNAADTCGCG